VFPKVIANGTRDTIIQITNTSNTMRHAHCFYVNGALTVPGLPPGPNNPPLCTETDFDIWLTKQQPTHWVVSAGRQVFPADLSCQGTRAGQKTPCVTGTSGGAPADCCDAGIDPGRIPPVAPDFIGELKCIEVDAVGTPIAGNSLKGEATIEDIVTGDVTKYNALGLKGFDQNDGNATLCLGGQANADLGCPGGAEYEACPATWIIDSASVGAPDNVVEHQEFCGPANCSTSLDTNLTIVPCTENFETQQPLPVTLQFAITNEFEQTFSASTTISCFASFSLAEVNPIFQASAVQGSLLQTRMRSAAGSQRGVMAVIEETHTMTVNATTQTASSAQNVHTTFQNQTGPDIITIPSDQVPPPVQ